MKKTTSYLLLSLVCYCFTNCESDSVDINDQQQIEQIEQIAKELAVDLRVDKSVNEKNAIVFKDEKGFKKFIIDTKEKFSKKILINNPDKNNLSNRASEMCDDFTGNVDEILLLNSGFSSLVADVRVVEGDVKNVDPYFMGFTLGVSYSHLGHRQFEPYIFSIPLEIDGIISYNLFFRGLGTIYSQRVTFYTEVFCII